MNEPFKKLIKLVELRTGIPPIVIDKRHEEFTSRWYFVEISGSVLTGTIKIEIKNRYHKSRWITHQQLDIDEHILPHGLEVWVTKEFVGKNKLPL